MPFGGFDTFLANENFLTPRIWAIALVLLAFERLLHEHHAMSLACIVASMLLHPVTGFSGLCIWVCWQLLLRLSGRWFAIVIVAVLAGTATVLLLESLGTAAFGHMDDQWRGFVTAANPYCVPTEWYVRDWLRIVVAFAIVATGRQISGMTANVRRLLDAIMLVAAVGIVVGTVAPFLPYRLLLQGQAYRALWALQLVQIPILFLVVARMARHKLTPLANRFTLVILASFAGVTMTLSQMMLASLFVAAGYGWWVAGPKISDGRARALRFYTGVTLLAGVILSVAMVAVAFAQLKQLLLPLELLATMPQILGPFVTWGIALCLLLSLRRLFRNDVVYRGIAIVGWLGLQAFFALAPASSLYASLGVPQAEDTAFVEQYLARHATAAHEPSAGAPMPVLAARTIAGHLVPTRLQQLLLGTTDRREHVQPWHGGGRKPAARC